VTIAPAMDAFTSIRYFLRDNSSYSWLTSTGGTVGVSKEISSSKLSRLVCVLLRLADKERSGAKDPMAEERRTPAVPLRGLR
jgi:hypothetical protein